MWRTAVITFIGLALLACGVGSGGEPAAQPTVTLTPAETAQPKSEVPCIDQFPEVALHYGEQTQQDPYLYYSWLGDDCAVDGHPFITIPLPASALTLPAGARPVLTFSRGPRSATATIRPLPLGKTLPTADGIEIDVNELHAILAETLDVQAIAEQELDLGPLSPGDYVVEVASGWPEGGLGFAFRIEIVEAVAD
ncbi:MAG: hypothetical protein IH866_02250 [Chloroflexi bacterium]|nr:hypothetical protein [Chloroflexota bacterium]